MTPTILISATLLPGTGQILAASDGGLTLTVPAGAVLTPTQLVVTPADPALVIPPEGWTPAGPVYQFNADLTFNVPLTVTLAYSGTPAASLTVHTWFEAAWHALATTVEPARQATAQVSRVERLALWVQETGPAPGVTPSPTATLPPGPTFTPTPPPTATPLPTATGTPTPTVTPTSTPTPAITPSPSPTPTLIPPPESREPGPPAHISVRLEQGPDRPLPADGRTRSRLVALVTDEHGRPVADGTGVSLQAEGGQVSPSQARTREGLVFARLQAGDQAQPGRVVVQAGDAVAEVPFELAALTLDEVRVDDGMLPVDAPLPFDLAEVVEQSRNTIHAPARGLPFVEQAGHRAEFGAGRLHFRPLGGEALTTPLTLTVELASVYVGRRPLFQGPAQDPVALEGNVARFERGQWLVEEYVARDSGVEQRLWVEDFHGPPGDLVVAVEVETALTLAPAEGGEGYVFRAVEEQAETMVSAASYGRALALDAAGRAKRAHLQAEEVTPTQPGLHRYRLEMTFPAEWLAGATYPLLIDPLVGGLLRVDAALTQPGAQAKPAVAYNDANREYLVVWQDSRDSGYDIYGQFVLADGLLAGENFTITAASGDQLVPDVAYNPDDEEYLVVWRSGDFDIKGRIVSAGGIFSPELEVDVPMISSPSNNPAVAYSTQAGSWLVTWQNGVSTSDIYARAIDGTGNMGATFTVSTNLNDKVLPDAAANGNSGFLVVWEQGNVETTSVYARRVTTASTAGDTFAVDTDSKYSQVAPAITYNPDDDEYLVAWQELAEYDAIWGRQVRGQYDPGGEFVGDAFQVDTASQTDCGTPAVTYFAANGEGGGLYLVAWQQQNGAETDLQAQRVLTDATLSGTPLALSDAEGDQANVALGFGPALTETLAAWTDERAGNQDVYARLVLPDGSLKHETIVHPAPGDQGMPQVAYNPTDDEYLVVWHDYRQGTDDPDIYAQRVSGEGLLVGTNITVTHAAYRQTYPYVAYATAGGVYLVAWRHYPGASNDYYDTYGQILSRSGELVGDNPLFIADRSGYADREAPNDIVYNSTSDKFLVLWQDLRSGYWNIWGRHVSVTGTLEAPIQITFLNLKHESQSAGAYNPDDDQYLIVYQYRSAPGQPDDVRARRMTGSGTVTSTETIYVATGSADQGYPNAVYLSDSLQRYAIVWEDNRHSATNGYDVYGQLVAPDATLDGANFLVSGTAQDERFPRLTLDTTGGALAVWQRDNGGSDGLDLYGRWLGPQGDPSGPAFAILERADDQQRPVVAGDAAGGYLLAWQDNRNGNWDIYGSLFAPLRAGFSATPTLGTAPLQVAFSDESTPAGVADEWRWSFGDGGTSTLAAPGHTYTETGVYTVTQWVTDTGTGETNVLTRTHLITVSPGALQAGFTAWPANGPVPLTVALVNSSTGEYSTNQWGFGDGLTSTLESPTHIYTTVGVYTVSLTVSGPGGSDTLTRTNYITVTPRADFSAEPLLGLAPLGVDFSDASQGDIIERRWDFGDGTQATEQHPFHEYTAPGMYTVTLAVTDTGGLSHTETRTHYIAALEAITTGVWLQTNWEAGDGQLYWADTTRYWSDDGRVDTGKRGEVSLLPLPSDVKINVTDTATDSHHYPAIAVNSDGDSCVAWQRVPDGTGSSAELYLQKLDSDGRQLWNDDVQVASDLILGPELAAVATDAAGNCYVVWQDNPSGNLDIYAQKYDISGNPIWASGGVRANDTTTADQVSPDVAVASAGNVVLVTWEDYRNSASLHDIFSQKLDASSGARQWANDRQIDNSVFDFHASPAIAVSATEADYYVAWRGGAKIYARKCSVSDGSCSGWGAPVVVWQGVSANAPSCADAALDAEGHLYVSWADKRTGTYNLYAQKLGTNGSKSWGAAGIQVNGAGQVLVPLALGSSTIGVDTEANLYLAWQDDRWIPKKVFLQKLDGDGNRAWLYDVQTATDETAQQDQRSPAIAVDPAGNSYVVWTDYRESPSSSDIYGQKYDAEAAGQWGGQPVSGTLKSSIFQLDYVAEWGLVNWTATEPPGTAIQVEVSANEGLTWTQVVSGADVGLVGDSLVYRVTLSTTEPYTTPVLHDLAVLYTPDPTQPATAPRPPMDVDELEVARLINDERMKRGLPPLEVNERLFRGARLYSEQMAATDTLSHELTPSGEERCVEEGYGCWPDECVVGYNQMGENIACGQQTAAGVVDTWMDSAGHREAILNPLSREIGVGKAFGGTCSPYWTAEFGAQPNVIPIFINHNETWTASRVVTVTLGNEFAVQSIGADWIMGLATEVQVSLSPSFSGAVWLPYPVVTATTTDTPPIEYYVPLTVAVTLPPEPGVRSVYARFRDAQGRMTISRDTIRYAPPAPTGATLPQLPPAMAYFQSPLFVGAATFDYPIEAAPGTAGLAPNLALRYNSYVAEEGWNQQSGWTGLGVSFDLGFVARRPDWTPADTSDDSFVLYLDGVYYPLIYSDAALGGDGYYHTERETHWRIERLSGAPHGVDGGEYWLVTTRDGTQHRFGYNADSAWRYVDDGGAQHLYRFNLDRLEDTHTNYLTASYDRDTASYNGADYERGGYLAQVLYSGNVTTGAPARRRVDFSHSSREIGGVKDYDPAWRFYLADKLDAVEVRVDDGAGSWDLVRRYELAYAYQSYGSNPGDKRLLLTGISIQGSDGTSLLENTTLAYHPVGTTGQGRLASAGDDYGAQVSYTYEAFESPAGKSRRRMKTRTDDPGTIEGIQRNFTATMDEALGSLAPTSGDSSATLDFDFGETIEIWKGDAEEFVGHVTMSVTQDIETGRILFHELGAFIGMEIKRICMNCCEDAPDPQASAALTSEFSAANTGVWVGWPPYWEQIKNYAALGWHNGVDFVFTTSEVDTAVCSVSVEWDRQTSYLYDEYGNLTVAAGYGSASHLSDDQFAAYTYTYNTEDWIVDRLAVEVVEDVQGNRVAEKRYYYDGHTDLAAPPDKGDVTRVEQMLLEESRGVSTVYGYDDYGNMTGVTDPKGNQTTTVYDDVYHTFPVTEIYPMVNGLVMSTTSEYDARWGAVTSSTDVNGQTTEFDHDVHGRLTRVWAPPDVGSGTPTVAYEYSDLTLPYRMVTVRQKEAYGGADALDEWTYYNGGGQLLQAQFEMEDPNQIIVVDYTYDHMDRLTSASVPYTVTHTGGTYLTPDPGQPRTYYTYDRRGRVTRMRNPDGSQVWTFYHGWRFMTVRDENGYLTRYTLDGQGRTVQVEEFSQGVLGPLFPVLHSGSGGIVEPPLTPDATTRYAYDAEGRLARVTDAKGHVTSITYDSLSRKTAMSDPDLGTWTYTYDDNDNLLTQTDARGVVTTLAWDAWDRPESKTFSDDTPDVTYTYDQGTYGKGRLAAMDNGVSRRAYTYDAVGRVEAETTTVHGAPYTTGYSYDPLGRVRTMTYPGGEVVTHDYNAQGLLEGLSGAVDYVTEVEYNALGQPTRLALGNGRTTTYQYEPDSFRLARLTTDGVLQDLSYDYDATGNVTALFDGVTGLDLGYEYDFVNRLVGVSGTYSRTYEYDSLGNLTNKAGITQAYTDPAHPHAVTGRSDGKSYAYDLNGNMIDRAGQTLTWDAENRLTEVVSGTTTTTFAYDGNGVRVKKTVGDSTTIYVGPHFEVEISGTQTISTSYYYALGRPVAMRTQDGVTETVRYLHGDHLGSASVVSDEAGHEVGRASYYPFGEVYTSSGVLHTDRMFTGQRLDETGLYYYGARYYDPVTGRFAQPDTIIPSLYLPQDLNRYSYVRNNPLFYVDSGGRHPIVAVVVAAIKLVSVIVDWGWTAWDAFQAARTMINICLPEDERVWATLAFALALGFESFEPDELLLNLPIDDVARRKLLDLLKRVWREEGWEGVVRLLRKELGDEATEELLRQLDEIGIKLEGVEGYIRAVPEDWVGQLRAFKTYPGEDGLSVFERVSPEDVLAELSGNRVPNTTVTIPRNGLPPGTQVVPTDAPGLSRRLSEAHRVLIRPEGWSVDKFAKALKALVGWK